MKRLDDFRVEKTQMKNIQGGCALTHFLTPTGSLGTDSWCDKNGDGKMTRDEVTDKKASTSVGLYPNP